MASLGSHRHDTQALSAGGLLIALGIIYGDIGTSPLYVLKAIAGDHVITDQLVLGGLSCIFWTLTLQTTLKYVLLTLRADNKGEGGIFALYTLVRRGRPMLIFPAIAGGSALLADGIITPPISVSSAVEGLRLIYPDIATVPIVIAILMLLFSVQRFGTRIVGRSFGPVMLVWFTMLAVLGFSSILDRPYVLAALSPHWAYELLVEHPHGFWLLGAVFLCTTGAEALYSDLGHCGRKNIKVSWAFVKSALLLNYFGQGAWLLNHEGGPLNEKNPFFELMPSWFLITGIFIATLAAIIASQALISGSFTIVNEAMRLYLFPKLKVAYPTELRGQLFIPDINTFLFFGCVGVVLLFRESSNMEAAYGLAITIAMMMTTILLTHFLVQRRAPKALIVLFLVVYLSIELAFLIANLKKFSEGGYVTVVLGALLSAVMWIWHKASQLKRRYTEYVRLKEQLPLLQDLSVDTSVAKTATNLVYLTGSPIAELVESKIVYSLFRKNPKRADVYWFIHVNVQDEPHICEYEVTTLVPGKVIRIDFNLGFRVEPRINLLFRQVLDELEKSGEFDIRSRYESLRKHGVAGDFRFVVLEKNLSYDNDLPLSYQMTMDGYALLRRLALSEPESFGLDTSSVTIEKVPLLIAPYRNYKLVRIPSEESQSSALAVQASIGRDENAKDSGSDSPLE